MLAASARFKIAPAGCFGHLGILAAAAIYTKTLTDRPLQRSVKKCDRAAVGWTNGGILKNNKIRRTIICVTCCKVMNLHRSFKFNILPDP